MNDPLEDQLRQLRPGPLSARLSERLAVPPSLEDERDASGTRWQWTAGAAAAVVLLAGVAASFWLHGREAMAVPLARSSDEQLVDVRTVAVVSDGDRRAWEIVELDFVDQETLVGGTGGLAVQTESSHRQFVPVELHFD